MNLVRCKQQIKALYESQPSLRYDYPKLTRQARGENKEYCLKEFGGIGKVDTYLLGTSDVDTGKQPAPQTDEETQKDDQNTAPSTEGTNTSADTGAQKEHNAAGVIEQVVSRDRMDDIREDGRNYLSSS